MYTSVLFTYSVDEFMFKSIPEFIMILTCNTRAHINYTLQMLYLS